MTRTRTPSPPTSPTSTVPTAARPPADAADPRRSVLPRLGGFASLALGVLLAACSAPAPGNAAKGELEPEPADLVLLDARIATLDPARPRATALAARDGRLIASTTQEGLTRRRDTRYVVR